MITLYTETMKRAAMDDVTTDADKEIVDGQFDHYVSYCEDTLSSELGGEDKVDARDIDSGATCCHTTTLKEVEAWRNLPGFWEWYN